MLFLCLIVICLYLNELTLAFTPSNIVLGHSAVYADSKLFITGGIYPKDPNNLEEITFSKEFYYLDVGKPFGVGEGDSIPWVDLSSVSQILPTHSWSSFSNCGHNDSLILYIGKYGVATTANVARSVYIYEISSQRWSNPTTANPPQINFHSQSQTVCDVNTGKMYRYSGNYYNGANNYNNIMDILDTSTLVWKTRNAPEARFDHTGTLLPNGYIVYIGGRGSKDMLIDMSKLSLYNTNNDTWTLMNAAGNSPTPRAYHSAVLTQDGRIIVYGGYGANGDVVKDDLVILDTSKPVYTWSNTDTTYSPPSRFYHTATLVGDYMIVVFGRKKNKYLPPPTSNEVFILDTSDKSNYKWVSEFVPNPILPPTPQNRNLGIIILLIVLALIVASFLIYFYRKRRLSRPDKFVHFPQIN